MSFNTLKVADLRNIADEFGVEIEKLATKSLIIKELEENGVTFELYSSMKNKEEDKVSSEEAAQLFSAPKQKKLDKNSDDVILIKMERSNIAYELYGVRFTREHPYALVETDTAQKIFEVGEGFRPATPKELQDYYG